MIERLRVPHTLVLPYGMIVLAVLAGEFWLRGNLRMKIPTAKYKRRRFPPSRLRQTALASLKNKTSWLEYSLLIPCFGFMFQDKASCKDK
jgi:hypothetical protein